MPTGIFVLRKVHGKNVAQELPDPPHGKRHIVVLCSTETHDKIGGLDPNGHWEGELASHIEHAIEEFVRTRPVHISTPAKSAGRAGVKLYDPRDPLRHPIN